MPGVIRVVSWNIKLGRQVETAVRELTTLKRLKDADVVLLQEMDPAASEHVAMALDMAVVYAAPADHPKTGKPFGNAVLSRWPVSHTIEVNLPGVAPIQGQPRSIVGTTISIHGQLIQVYSVHLETVMLQLRQRVEQVRAVADHLALSTPHPVIVGGDFNSASNRSLRAFDQVLATAELKRVTEPATTFRRFRRPYSLDHIYTRNLRATATGVVTEGTASDHWPIWAQVEAEPAAPCGPGLEDSRIGANGQAAGDGPSPAPYSE